MSSKNRPELAQSELVESLPAACANEAAAVEFLESQRWGGSPKCPECESATVYQMRKRTGERDRFLWRCRDCSRQFTVRTGTVYAESLLPLRKWLRALWESAVCKNGISAMELSRKIQVSYKTALFVMHRIRHAMTETPNGPKLSGTVECDETYVGGKPRYGTNNKRGRGASNKVPVFALVQRGGDVRASVVANVRANTLGSELAKWVDPKGTTIVTDDFKAYRRVAREFAPTHKYVRHSLREYVSPIDPTVHTNTIEGFFSRLKRKIIGTHHAVSPAHLHRYVAECAFVYNARQLNDGARITALVKRTEGKRLMYREPTRKGPKAA